MLSHEEIAKLFCERLKEENLQKYPTYVAFTNAHWERFKEIRTDFHIKNGLYEADLINVAPIQQGVMLYLAS